MEKGEREIRERKGRGGRRGEGEKGAMGVDPTKFGKKSMPVFIRVSGDNPGNFFLHFHVEMAHFVGILGVNFKFTL